VEAKWTIIPQGASRQRSKGFAPYAPVRPAKGQMPLCEPMIEDGTSLWSRKSSGARNDGRIVAGRRSSMPVLTTDHGGGIEKIFRRPSTCAGLANARIEENLGRAAA